MSPVMSPWILIACAPSTALSHFPRRRRCPRPRPHRHHIVAGPEIWGSSAGSRVVVEASNESQNLQRALIVETSISVSYGRAFVFQVVGFDEATNDATLVGVAPNHCFLKRMYGVHAYTACRRHPARRPFVCNVLPRQPQSPVVRREAQSTVARLDEERCRYSQEGANWLLLSGHLHVAASGVDWARWLHSALEQ